MKKLEKLSILITIVLISLLTLSAVSAVETEDINSATPDKDIQTIDNTQSTITPDSGDANKQIEKTEKKTILKSENTKENTVKGVDDQKSFTDLNSTIQNKINNHEYVLELENNYTRTDSDDGFENGITIDGNKLNGNTFTIKGKGGTKTINAKTFWDYGTHIRIFNVTNGAHLILENLNLCNSYAENGGAIYVNTGSRLTINNSTFNYNSANFGGAIYADIGSYLTINNNIFYYNPANYSGGVIYANSATITITNSILNTNLGCDQYGKGGAIYIKNRSTLTLDNNTFNNNHAKYGGAIYANKSSTININNTIFYSNTAGYGGGIYIDEDSSATINNSIFENNQAYSDGGAIYNKETLNVSKGIFRNNYAENGGAIYNNKTVNIIKSIFEDNYAYDSDGGAIYSNGTLNVSKSTFANDKSNGRGYEIYGEKDLIMNDNFIIYTNDMESSDSGNIRERLIDGKITGKNNKIMTEIELIVYTFTKTQSEQINPESNLTEINKKISELIQENTNLKNTLKEINNKLSEITKTKASTKISLVLTSNKITKKSKRAKFIAKLKINNKAVKGKIVIFTFRGKVFTAKTNKKGIAKVIIKKKLLRKLLKKVRPGEKIICQAKYGSTAVKVLTLPKKKKVTK